MNLEFATEVIDGDTFKGVCDRPLVRLAGFDAPELNTLQGFYAKTYLENLISGKVVSIGKIATDIYGRDIAEVRLAVGNSSANEEMRKRFSRRWQ